MFKKNRKRGKAQTNAVSLVTIVDKNSPVAEQYRTIRTNIQFAAVNHRRIKVLVVTPAGPGAGGSTAAANLAVVFADAGRKTLLVGADMRRPTIYKTFGLNNGVGLSTTLSTRKTVVESVQTSVIPNLSVLTSGPAPSNPSELLGSSRMNQVLAEMCNLYDVVIFDMPPVVAVTDAQIMAAKADGTIIVARENVSKREALTKSKDLLEKVNAHVLGVVYNGSESAKDKGYYYNNDDD